MRLYGAVSRHAQVSGDPPEKCPQGPGDKGRDLPPGGEKGVADALLGILCGAQKVHCYLITVGAVLSPGLGDGQLVPAVI